MISMRISNEVDMYTGFGGSNRGGSTVNVEKHQMRTSSTCSL